MCTGFALFETSIGHCGVAWGPDGIVGVALPEPSADRLRARMRRKWPDADETEPPPHVGRAIVEIRGLLNGEARDLASVPLDLSRVGDFNRRVYEIARAIPPGATLTYGEVAEKLGDKTLAQAVGRAMGENPFPIVVPCHRVTAANGKAGGFSAPGGVKTKLKLLAIEERHRRREPDLFDALR